MFKHIITSFLLLLFATQALAVNPDDLLRPEVAFKPTVSANTSGSDNESIQVTWAIADGYYMYKKRFKFKSETAGITLGEPIIPKGKIKDDPGFGTVETYRDQVSITVPFTRDSTANGITELAVKTSSQGCADLGICYPPQKKTLTLALTAVTKNAAIDSLATNDSLSFMQDGAASNKPLASSSGMLIEKSDLASQLGIENLAMDNSPLDPDEAFVLDITASDRQSIKPRWDIVEGHYLYQHKFAFALVDAPAGVSLGKAQLPKGKAEHDQYFGDIVTYNKSFTASVPLLGAESGNNNTDSITVKTSYQGCSKITGICYPPQHKTQTVSLPKSTAVDSATINTTTSIASTTATNAVKDSKPAKVSEQESFVNKMKQDNFFVVLGGFFLAGLALTFTPCVFPMIPILSGIIAGQGSKTSTQKSFFLSLSYVLVMALTYAIVGVFAAMSGENLQVALQNPWVIGAFAILFVILSLSMFGFYELQMPSSVQSKLTNISNSQEGGNIMSAGIMGFLSALIVGPCVTAPLIGALIYIAQTKDMILGGFSLFALGLGMGVPLLIIGTSAGKILPRAGAWMDKVKAAFGIMMLALAIWMLERILPFNIIVILTGILTVFTGIYMGALDALSEASTGWKRFFKAAGLVVLLYGAALLIGAASGNASLLKPLHGFTGGGSASSPQHLNFKKIKGITGLEDALALAKQQKQTVMLDFYADWCISCKEMEHNTFTDSAVIDSLKNTLLIQADVTLDDAKDKALNKRFGLFGPPAILFFDKNGTENTAFRVVGYKGPKDFLQHVEEFKQTLQKTHSTL